jgi:acyl carrier protein
LKDKILSILIEARPESDFSASSNFITDGLLDSMDMVVLIGEIEEQFEISIEGTSIVPDNFVSLETIIRLIESSR